MTQKFFLRRGLCTLPCLFPMAISVTYSVFLPLKQVKFANGGSILSSSQFFSTDPAAFKIRLAIKVVEIDSEKIISLPGSKSVKQTVYVYSSQTSKTTLLIKVFY